jgi:hypothetical protein
MISPIKLNQPFSLDNYPCEVLQIRKSGIKYRFTGEVPYKYRNVNGFNLLTFAFLQQQLHRRVRVS